MNEEIINQLNDLINHHNALSNLTAAMFAGGALSVPEKHWQAMSNKLSDHYNEKADIRSEVYRLLNEVCPGLCPGNQ